MSETLISIVGGGGGQERIMPIFTALQSGLKIKDGAGSVKLANSTPFYTTIEADHSAGLFDTATLQPVADQLEQTIVDTGTGKSGVLTQVMGARTSGTMIIRVYIDGSITEFEHTPPSSDYVMCVGDFSPWEATNLATSAVGVGSRADIGWVLTNSSRLHTMLSPENSAAKGLPIGMVFEDSLKVTFQAVGSAAIIGSTTTKAVAAWLNYIPEGLVI